MSRRATASGRLLMTFTALEDEYLNVRVFFFLLPRIVRLRHGTGRFRFSHFAAVSLYLFRPAGNLCRFLSTPRHFGRPGCTCLATSPSGATRLTVLASAGPAAISASSGCEELWLPPYPRPDCPAAFSLLCSHVNRSKYTSAPTARARLKAPFPTCS